MEKALDAANNAAGTAQEEQDKYMKSMQGHIDQLTATWQVLSNDIMNGDFLKGLISGATSFLDLLDNIVNKVGVIPTLIGAISAGLSFKNVGVFKTMNGEITLLGQSLSKVADDVSKLGLKGGISNLLVGDKRGLYDNDFLKSLNNDKKSIFNFADAVNNKDVSKETAFSSYMKTASQDAQEYVKNIDAAKISIQDFDKQQRLTQIGTVAQSKGLSNVSKIIGEYNQGFTNTSHTQAEFLKTVTQSNQGLGNYLSGLNGAKGSLSGYIGSLISAKAATLAMQAATMALNMALSMGVAFAVSAAITAIMNLADKMDTSFAKAVERAQESKRVFEESASDVDEVKTRLEDVKTKISEAKATGTTNSKDISNLETQKSLLEAQLEIKEKIAKTNEEKANRDAEKALTQKRGYEIESLKDENSIVDRSYFLSGSGGSVNVSMGYGSIIDEVRRKQELLNEATQKYNDLVIKHSKTKDDSKWKQEEKQLADYSAYIEKLSTEVNEGITGVSEQVDTLAGKAGYEKLVNDAQSLYKEIDSGTEKIKTVSEIAEGMGLNLNKILGGEGQENRAFEDKVNDYITKINELNEAKRKYLDDNLSEDDKKNLFYDFPELQGQTESLDTAIGSLVNTMNTDITGEFNSQISKIKSEDATQAMLSFQDAVMGVGTAMVNVDDLTTSIKSAQEDFSALGTAMTESNSATGLSIESMEKLETMYSGLKGYDSAQLFERTASGIKLNADELQRLNTLYEENQSKDISDTLEQLNKELATAKEAQKSATTDDQRKVFQDRIDGLQNEINQVQNLSSMWDSATSAYNRYLQAQAGGTSHDTLEGFIKDKENIEKMMNAGWGDNESVTTFWDTIFSPERTLSNKEALEQFNKEIENTGHSLNDYLVFENGELQASGIKTFVEDIKSGLGEDYVSELKDGTTELNLQGDNLQKISDYLGLNSEFVEMFTNSLRDMPDFSLKFDGVDTGVDKTKDSVQQMSMSIDEAKQKIQSLQAEGSVDNKINIGIDVDTASSEQIKQTLDQLGKVKIDAEVDPSGAAALETLKSELQQEYYLKVNVETGGKLEEAEGYIKRIKELAGKDPINIAIKGDNGQEISNLADKLQKMPKEVKVPLGIEMKDSSKDILGKIGKDEVKVTGTVDWKVTPPEDVKVEDKEATVKYKKDSKEPDGYKPKDKNATVKYKKDSSIPDGYQPKDKSATVTYHIKTVGSAPSGAGGVDGTAHISGTAHAQGTAFKQGYWGTKNSGFALGGEEDTELLVRNGHWYTIGEDSTEFFGYKKGDIIFNAEQTKQIFEKGKITHGKKRGTSFSTGTAFADGTAFKKGSGKKSKEDKKLKKFQDWFAKLFDWIEIRIKRVSDKITQYTKKADAALKAENFGSASKNYRGAINATATQINVEREAASKYQSEANKVLNKAIKKGLISKSKAKGIKKKFANGTLNIAEYGERMREVIKDYQTWADKAISAKDSISELHDKIREYIKDLKDVRDAERKAKQDRYSAFEKISTSGYTSTSGAFRNLNNSQLDYKITTLQRNNKAYSREIRNIESDNNSVAKSARKTVNKQVKSAKSKYKKALKTAQNAIKAKKKISNSTLKTIRKNSIATYEKLYAYNLSFSNLETAKLERAVEYAANSAEIFKDISGKYEKLDTATKNTQDLNKQKSKNATSANTANRLLDSVARGYDTVLENDAKEIKQYNKSAKSNGKRITSYKNKGNKYKQLSSSGKKAVQKYVNAAKKRVKAGVTIAAGTIGKLAEYYSKGYISESFFNSCINYNNALEYRREAEAQKEIDKQTAIQEKAAIAEEKFNNVKQEYTNKLNSNQSKTNLIKAKQEIKETRGLTLSERDYQALITQTKNDRKIYETEIKSLNKTINDNLKKKYWTKNSQSYLDAIKEVNEFKVKIQECIKEQEDLNNKIIQLPYDKYELALNKLDALYKARTASKELTKELGKNVSEGHYQLEIQTIEDKIKEAENLMNQAKADYEKAMSSSEKVYGDKNAKEWQIEYNKYRSDWYDLQKDLEKLKDELRDDVYWREFEKAHKEADRLKDVLNGVANLLSNDMFFDKNGDVTEWGIDQIALLTKEYENARDEVENYSNDIQNLTKLYSDGWYTQEEYNEKLNEFQKKLLDSASNMKKYMESIKDMYKEMDKAELDALYKLIDKRKEALDKKKAYYDYDKNIRNKNKDIQELQSQITALEGITDASSKAKRAKLQEELAEKQEDLNDTLLDHNIDLSKEALEDLKKLLEDEYDDKWEKITQDLDKMLGLLQAANDLTSASASSVSASLEKLLSYYGVNAVETKISETYASGTKYVPRNMKALTNENGDEIIVTKNGLITPLKTGDGVIPADLTQKLYDLAMGITPNIGTPKYKIPDLNMNPNIQITQHYDALIHIDGSADAATVQDLKDMKKGLLETSYQYTTNRIMQDNIRTGGIRRI